LADPLLVPDKRAARIYLYRRVLLALLTGNGDLHLENLALMGGPGEAAFSPVYDPTPMRAYSMHNMLCAVPFGGYGEEIEEGTDPLIQACHNFAASLSLNKKDVVEIAGESLELCADYAQRVGAIDSLPDENKERLIDIHRDMQKRLGALV
ncbi:MAG TPA: hypothetical protein ENJ80_07510, partial [Gammaproteobacteria bacterium]|nr:hypothetical protein [Gammaproteobacteria bacterium]